MTSKRCIWILIIILLIWLRYHFKDDIVKLAPIKIASKWSLIGLTALTVRLVIGLWKKYPLANEIKMPVFFIRLFLIGVLSSQLFLYSMDVQLFKLEFLWAALCFCAIIFSYEDFSGKSNQFKREKL